MRLASVDLGQGAVHVQQAGPANQPLDRDPVVALTQDPQDFILDRLLDKPLPEPVQSLLRIALNRGARFARAARGAHRAKA